MPETANVLDGFCRDISVAPRDRRLVLKYGDGLVVCGCWGPGPDIRPEWGFWTDQFLVGKNYWHLRGPAMLSGFELVGWLECGGTCPPTPHLIHSEKCEQ